VFIFSHNSKTLLCFFKYHHTNDQLVIYSSDKENEGSEEEKGKEEEEVEEKDRSEKSEKDIDVNGNLDNEQVQGTLLVVCLILYFK